MQGLKFISVCSFRNLWLFVQLLVVTVTTTWSSVLMSLEPLQGGHSWSVELGCLSMSSDNY